MTFVDDNQGNKMVFDPITDSTFYDNYTADTDLADFLERSVEIATLTWALGTPLSGTLLPWQLFFNNAAIKKKLDNYAFLACNLELTFKINGAPGYYGDLMFSYQPMYDFEPGKIASGATGDELILLKSQRSPVHVYPQTNQGGTMLLPYINYSNWIACGVNYDLGRMGQLHYDTIFDLTNNNAVVGTDVNITIYARAVDVRVSGPSLQLAAQADEFEDPDGTISGPATAVADAAGALNPFLPPIIRPFAMATQIGASAISAIAKIFGYSKIPIIESSKPVKNMPFHAFSSTETSTPIDRLTLDPKQELSIDPRILGGTSHDEMAISHIVTRNSIIGTYNWTATDTKGSLLFCSRVTPNIAINTAILSGGQIRQARTPAAHVAEAFQCWRGDCIFTFKFVKSSFHRGRVRISYDPYSNDLLTTSDTYATNYNNIVDIEQDTVVEFRIPYKQRTAWCNTIHESTTNQFGHTTCPSRADTYDNGLITMRVETEQTSLSASNDIGVVVSFRMAENAEFAKPKDLNVNQSFFEPQSEDVIPDDLATCHMFNDGTSTVEDAAVYMGEKIGSIRALLQRTTLTHVIMDSDTYTDGQMVQLWSCMPRYPLCYGYDPNGFATAATISAGTGGGFNPVKQTYFNHFSACYVGHRGSVDWHQDAITTVPCSMRITRSTRVRSKVDYKAVTNWVPPGVSNAQAFQVLQYDTSGCTGTSLTNARTNTGNAANIPFYSIYRFTNTNPVFRMHGTAADETNYDSVIFNNTFSQEHDTGATDRASNFGFKYYFNTGVDYSCMFFLNVPSVYIYSGYPTITA